MKTALTSLAFFEAAQGFIDVFNSWAEKISLKVTSDHIGYTCADSTEFEQLRSFFERESVFIYQSLISRRRIAIIKFLRPLKTSCGEIAYLELSDQKPDYSQISGFNHIEIYPSEGTIESLLMDCREEGMTFEKVERPHHTTYDALLIEGFKIRIEAEPLIKKIKMMEMTEDSSESLMDSRVRRNDGG